MADSKSKMLQDLIEDILEETLGEEDKENKDAVKKAVRNIINEIYGEQEFTDKEIDSSVEKYFNKIEESQPENLKIDDVIDEDLYDILNEIDSGEDLTDNQENLNLEAVDFQEEPDLALAGFKDNRDMGLANFQDNDGIELADFQDNDGIELADFQDNDGIELADFQDNDGIELADFQDNDGIELADFQDNDGIELADFQDNNDLLDLNMPDFQDNNEALKLDLADFQIDNEDIMDIAENIEGKEESEALREDVVNEEEDNNNITGQSFCDYITSTNDKVLKLWEDDRPEMAEEFEKSRTELNLALKALQIDIEKHEGLASKATGELQDINTDFLKAFKLFKKSMKELQKFLDTEDPTYIFSSKKEVKKGHSIIKKTGQKLKKL